MLWTCKLTGQQPYKLDHGSTDILILSNACLVPSKPKESVSLTIKIGQTKMEVCHLTAQKCQAFLQIMLEIGKEPQFSLSNKKSQVHLIGYYYPTPLEIESTPSDSQESDESRDSQLDAIRLKKSK